MASSFYQSESLRLDSVDFRLEQTQIDWVRIWTKDLWINVLALY